MAAGHPPRVLLLVHPSNPLGTICSHDELVVALRFCDAHALHLVCDEIYANSVFPASASTASRESSRDTDHAVSAAEPSGFRSIVELMARASGVWGRSGEGAGPPTTAVAATPGRATFLGDRVHVVWGLSKDFGLSGYRVGAVYTHNAALFNAASGFCCPCWAVFATTSPRPALRALQLSNVAYFAAVSNDTQEVLAGVLEDLPWVDCYLAGNRALLAGLAAGVQRAAARCGKEAGWQALLLRVFPRTCFALMPAPRVGLPCLPASAGMFVWLDLRAPLRAFIASLARTRTGPHALTCTEGPPTWEDEEAFHRAIVERARVVLTPGAACHALEPGFARCCFAWMGPKSVEVAFDRLGSLFASL